MVTYICYLYICRLYITVLSANALFIAYTSGNFQWTKRKKVGYMIRMNLGFNMYFEYAQGNNTKKKCFYLLNYDTWWKLALAKWADFAILIFLHIHTLPLHFCQNSWGVLIRIFPIYDLKQTMNRIKLHFYFIIYLLLHLFYLITIDRKEMIQHLMVLFFFWFA